jgi:hypothetical protein
MNEIIELKMDFARSIIKHMPESVNVTYNSLEYDLMKQLHELSTTYLEKTAQPKSACEIIPVD